MGVYRVKSGLANMLFRTMRSRRNRELSRLLSLRLPKLTYSLSARLQDWLSTLISDHTPQSSPASTPPTSPFQAGEESILVVTHEECIMTLLNILVVSSSVRMSVAEGVDLGKRVGNGSVGIIKVWWDGDMEVRARLEAWAVESLAPVK